MFSRPMTSRRWHLPAFFSQHDDLNESIERASRDPPREMAYTPSNPDILGRLGPRRVR